MLTVSPVNNLIIEIAKRLANPFNPPNMRVETKTGISEKSNLKKLKNGILKLLIVAKTIPTDTNIEFIASFLTLILPIISF